MQGYVTAPPDIIYYTPIYEENQSYPDFGTSMGFSSPFGNNFKSSDTKWDNSLNFHKKSYDNKPAISFETGYSTNVALNGTIMPVAHMKPSNPFDTIQN